MANGVSPFQTPRTLPGAWDALSNDLNAYASRGFPMSMGLSDPYASHGIGTVGASSTLGSLEPLYVLNAVNQSAMTTATYAINVLRAVPFFAERGFRISRLGFSVVTGVANAKAVLGIYDAIDGEGLNLYPNRKLWNSVEFTPTASNATHEDAATLDLEVGKVYWAVYNCGTAAPTLRAVPATGSSSLIGTPAGLGAVTPSTYLSVASTYSSTLPTNFPTGGVVQSAVGPAIHAAIAKGSGVVASTRPLWSPDSDRWILRSAAFLSGSVKQSGTTSLNSLAVTLRLRNTGGATVIGSFDSRSQKALPGLAFPLMSSTDLSVPKGTILEAHVEQRGWPLVTVADCALTWVVARTGV